MADGLLNIALGAGIAPEDVKAIADAIDPDELTKLILDLSNIYSPSTGEAEASAFVHAWMEREGFRPLSVGAVPHHSLERCGGCRWAVPSAALCCARPPDGVDGLRLPAGA